MPTLTANGIQLYYEQKGKGQPLVLISGYTADISAWSLVCQELANHYQLLLFDNRGAGRSECPDTPYTIETMAEDVLALVEALGLQKFSLLGHSMGGAIAQTVAYKKPECIHKLILANTLIRLKEVPAFTLRYFLKAREEGMPLIKMLEGFMPWLFSSHFLSNPMHVAEFLHIVEKYPYSQSLVGQKRQLEAISTFNSLAWYKQLSPPTLVISGAEDIMCPQDSHDLANIPNAKHIIFPNQAHMTYIECFVEFVQAVIRFIS